MHSKNTQHMYGNGSMYSMYVWYIEYTYLEELVTYIL